MIVARGLLLLRIDALQLRQGSFGSLLGSYAGRDRGLGPPLLGDEKIAAEFRGDPAQQPFGADYLLEGLLNLKTGAV
jgi:hypothetical protein